ncbi:hypothetical protein D7Y15_26330 [Corallococcus sp. AB030]|uniref:hypothetical protein n=1 Tax=Corallococcus TaxID=83461 RepID=UPI000EBE03B8|nr:MULTISPECIES: hypothetical protein [Corallococcus]NRD52905.1 hypothetical protein [Corallococcus exiguus]RKI08219.1 hypothetical protein D7Y15_26330 [Corallococcus sp. AB030]RUO94030.1 hypothetical protein D7Y11_06305 [Corallococcus sp. AB018]
MVAMKWKMGVSLVFVSAVAFAEQGVTSGSFPVERRNVVTVSVPLQNLNQLSLEGERVMGERFSVGLGVFASFAHQRSRFEEVQAGGLEGYDTSYLQFGLAPSVRFYLTGRAPQGLWVSPRLEASLGRISDETVVNHLEGEPPSRKPTDDWAVGGTAVLGYSLVVEPGFTVQGGVGFGARREAFAYDAMRLGDDGRLGMVRVRQATWLFTQRILLNVGWAF